ASSPLVHLAPGCRRLRPNASDSAGDLGLLHRSGEQRTRGHRFDLVLAVDPLLHAAALCDGVQRPEHGSTAPLAIARCPSPGGSVPGIGNLGKALAPLSRSVAGMASVAAEGARDCLRTWAAGSPACARAAGPKV